MHIKKYKLKYNVFVIVCFYQAGKKKKKKKFVDAFGVAVGKR